MSWSFVFLLAIIRPSFAVRNVIDQSSVETVIGSTSGSFNDGTGTNALYKELTGIVRVGDALYTVSKNGLRMRKYDMNTQEVTSVAGFGSVPLGRDGVGTRARFHSEQRLVTHSGMVYFTEVDGHTLRSFDPATAELKTVAGRFGALGSADALGTDARFHNPKILQVYQNDVFISEGTRVRKVDLTSMEVTTVATGLTAADYGASCFASPIYVYDSGNVKSIDTTTGVVTTVGALTVDNMRGMTCDPAGFLYYISDFEVGEYHPTTQSQDVLASGSAGGGTIDGMGTNVQFSAGHKELYWDVASAALYIADMGVIRRMTTVTQVPTSTPTITSAPSSAPTVMGPWKGMHCYEHPTRKFEEGICQPVNYVPRTSTLYVPYSPFRQIR